MSAEPPRVQVFLFGVGCVLAALGGGLLGGSGALCGLLLVALGLGFGAVRFASPAPRGLPEAAALALLLNGAGALSLGALVPSLAPRGLLLAAVGFALAVVPALSGAAEDREIANSVSEAEVGTAQGERCWLLDTSAIIDGRVRSLRVAGLLPGRFVVPRFVLEELQFLADRSGKAQRERGRRGLDVLVELREQEQLEVLDVPEANPAVDRALVDLARENSWWIISTDSGLLKVARAEGLKVLDLHGLVATLRTPVHSGMRLRLIVRCKGEGKGQGVSYLEDGTMVVIDGAAEEVGEEVDLEIKKLITTKVGPLVFARKVEEAA